MNIRVLAFGVLLAAAIAVAEVHPAWGNDFGDEVMPLLLGDGDGPNLSPFFKKLRGDNTNTRGLRGKRALVEDISLESQLVEEILAEPPSSTVDITGHTAPIDPAQIVDFADHHDPGAHFHHLTAEQAQQREREAEAHLPHYQVASGSAAPLQERVPVVPPPRQAAVPHLVKPHFVASPRNDSIHDPLPPMSPHIAPQPAPTQASNNSHSGKGTAQGSSQPWASSASSGSGDRPHEEPEDHPDPITLPPDIYGGAGVSADTSSTQDHTPSADDTLHAKPWKLPSSEKMGQSIKAHVHDAIGEDARKSAPTPGPATVDGETMPEHKPAATAGVPQGGAVVGSAAFEHAVAEEVAKYLGDQRGLAAAKPLIAAASRQERRAHAERHWNSILHNGMPPVSASASSGAPAEARRKGRDLRHAAFLTAMKIIQRIKRRQRKADAFKPATHTQNVKTLLRRTPEPDADAVVPEHSPVHQSLKDLGRSKQQSIRASVDPDKLLGEAESQWGGS